jgi:Initiator Replication protein.
MNNNVCTYEEVIRIDDDELVERLTESRNFRRYAVEKAKKEINEISDIKMDYKPIYGGKGGKTVGLNFSFSIKN